MDDFRYIPNTQVVSSARSFIRALCDTYGNNQGMAVWDHIRQGLGDQIASDIFLGMLTGTDTIRVVHIGEWYIEVIKEIRHLTGWTLKDTKDFCDSVRSGVPQTINVSSFNTIKIDLFLEKMKKLNCVVE